MGEEKEEMKVYGQKMVDKEEEIKEIHNVVQGRDAEIKRLRKDLVRFGARVDELEQQKAFLFTKFKEATGQRPDTLLQQFKKKDTLGTSEHDEVTEPMDEGVVER